ncbi:geranylgeranylglycerol-phosphate geranylgeranyltransferase [Wenyingzhuangia sp. IMCC45533]
MTSKATKKHKILGLFSVVRGYNVILLSIAQYLAAIFVFAVDTSLKQVFCDVHLHLVVLATICVVSSGYIINDFYDLSIDMINKPLKTQMGNWVSKKTKLQVYFTLNFIAFALGLLISWKAALFFAIYIFLIWLYSHKLKKYPVVKIIAVSILDVLPFFVIFVYYNHVSTLILTHGVFLFGLIISKEIIKDFRRVRGAILNNRETLVTKYGAYRVKVFFMILMFLMTIPTLYLFTFPEIGYMKYYFYSFIPLGPVFLFFLIKAKREKHYLWLHNVIKALLVVGVFSLMLVDTSVLLIRLLNHVKI